MRQIGFNRGVCTWLQTSNSLDKRMERRYTLGKNDDVVMFLMHKYFVLSTDLFVKENSNMNTQRKIIRFLIVLSFVLSALGISTSTALADQPSRNEYTITLYSVITDVCSFDVNVGSTIDVTEIDFFNQSGALTRIFFHQVEQDTFTANGQTLVGIPFTFNVEILFDSDGNITHVYANGIVERIPLPDGSLFISAGRLDFTAHPGVYFILSPDHGNSGNIGAFCAALAP